MLIRGRVSLAAVMAVCAAVLCYTALCAGDKSFDGMLLAYPKTEAGSADIDAVDEINDEKFLITYECVENRQASAVNKDRDVTVKGTNYTYPFVMWYTMQSGGFFTSGDEERGSATAVLNEKAAFELFGGVGASGQDVKIGGVKYRVVGVMNDGDSDTLNVYVPAGLVKAAPGAFLARLDAERGISEEYAKNELKQAGITDSRYDFVNLGVISGRVRAEAVLALILTVAVALIFVLRHSIGHAASVMRLLKGRGKRLYAKELITGEGRALVGLVMTFGLMAGVCVALIGLLEVTVNGFLLYGTGLADYTPVVFGGVMINLRRLSVYADIAFTVYAVCLALFVIMTCGINMRRGDNV